MSNIVLRNFSIRGLVTSIVLLLFGAAIIFFGIRELMLYYSEPVSIDALQDSFVDDTRVQLSSYRVAGVFDMPGYSYFIVEYSEGNYCLIETKKRRVSLQQATGSRNKFDITKGFSDRRLSVSLKGLST